jgi:hypothetical protein
MQTTCGARTAVCDLVIEIIWADLVAAKDSLVSDPTTQPQSTEPSMPKVRSGAL